MSDRTKATALAIAERKLISLGWRHGAKEIGEFAAAIINAMDSALKSEETPNAN